MQTKQLETLFKRGLIAAAASLLLIGCGAEQGKESFSDRVAKRFGGKDAADFPEPAWKQAAAEHKKAKEAAAAAGGDKDKAKEPAKAAAPEPAKAAEPAKPTVVEATIQATEEIAADVGAKISEATENIKAEVSESVNSLAAMATPSSAAPAENLKVAVKPTPEIIRQLQQALTDAGYNPGPVDGKTGGKTTEAMKKFQKDNNLSVGQITKETLSALGIAY